jgi:hypothetical protein
MTYLPLRVHCREIEAADIDRVANLLTNGFRKRTRRFWLGALARLTAHPSPPKYPKYGYLLECNHRLVGVLLLIYAVTEFDNVRKIRCNVSSWYVEPDYRPYAGLLVSRALRHRHITYFNITPDPPTFPILEAQGYTRYCTGRFIAVPALARFQCGWRVELVRAPIEAGEDLSPYERDLLVTHAAYGCMSLICIARGIRYPFVFLPRLKAGVVPFSYLAYCRSVADYVRCAGPLGRYLARHGFPLVVLDANGPVEGLVGRYSDGAPKYVLGSDPPRLGDIAYSERVMFGF